MSEIREKISKDRTFSMREQNKEKSLLLGTLLGELDRIPLKRKEDLLTDEQVLTVIKKMFDNNNEILKNEISTEAKKQLELENSYLSEYLPKTLSTEKLTTIIKDYIKENNLSGQKSIGVVMGMLKTKYTGQYDGKVVSEIIKSLI